MRKEDDLKKWARENAPSGVWWYNIPTQAGRAGLKLPFDSQMLWEVTYFALEFKWMRGYKGAAAHQLVALARVHEAGGIGLIVDGRDDGLIRVYDIADMGTEYYEWSYEYFYTGLKSFK